MRPQRTTTQTLKHACELRRDLTEAERKLWRALRSSQINGVQFRRQHGIGPYISDFCAISHRLIIEVDGGQHLEQADYDAERTAFLEAHGYRVLRFWNHDVLKNIDAVVQAIEDALTTSEG